MKKIYIYPEQNKYIIAQGHTVEVAQILSSKSNQIVVVKCDKFREIFTYKHFQTMQSSKVRNICTKKGYDKTMKYQ